MPRRWKRRVSSVVDVVQVVGVLIAAGAFVATAIELRASVVEQKRLRRRIDQERLEDLAIAIAQVKHAVTDRDAPATVAFLTEIGARAIPLRHDDYPDVWSLADHEFDPTQGWPNETVEVMANKSDAAQDEMSTALKRRADADG